MKSMPYKHASAGLTLLELMVTLLIVSILAGLAAPSMSNLISQSRLAAARDSLANAIMMARSEAVYSKQPVTICASTNQSSCSGGGDWDSGWIIFTDDAPTGSLEGDDAMIDVSYGSGNVLIGAGDDVDAITFLATGMRDIAGGANVVTIGVCDDSGNESIKGKALTVGLTGSLTYADADDAGCDS